MKFKKTSSNLYILLLITIGIFSSVRAMQSSNQQVETVVAKSNVVDYNSGAKDRQGALTDFSYRLLPVTQFEPLLLFVFGAVLLSIVTGVNIFRSRKIGFHLNSASQASLESHQKFRARGPKDYE